MVSRRALLASVPAATLSFPVIPVEAAPTIQSEGMLRITLDGRDLLVDTADLPAVWQVQDEDNPQSKVWISQPDEHDLYLIIGRHRTLEVSRLWPLNTTWLPHDPKRTRFVHWEGKNGYGFGQNVQVIGKVVSG